MRQTVCHRSVVVTVLAIVVVMCVKASSASAYDAALVWLPVSGAHGYKVYVSQTSQPGASGIDVGTPAPGSDGLIRYTVQGLPVNATSYFWVKSYNANKVESMFSNGLAFKLTTNPPGTGGTPGQAPTPTPNQAGSTPTPTATGTPRPPRRPAQIVLSGYFYTRPTRHITFAARYRNVRTPNLVVLTPPATLSLSAVKPSPNSLAANAISWQNVHAPYGKVRITFNIADAVAVGSTFSANVSLTDSYGNVTSSSATVKVTRAARNATRSK